ncbi:hypothetical protein GOQ30_11495 [Flavobacterium sp. TP390]|uniref:Uncharacterized protein n=1 Tax=Flavobacterium profundi TaxID=1774945 RepID=A0A6I4IJ43_9FLAO|nr:hypothetical protein [Flavobacterium profundi]MVO09783.1 hypothetical protein [Flavobacterium profundi]
MKKILTLLLFVVSFSVLSQEKISTSVEEYNYLLEELPKELALGNKMKDGFELKKIEQNTFKEFTYTYFLYWDTKNNVARAMLISAKKGDDKERLLCLPFNNNDLLEKFFKESEKLGASMKMYFDYSIYNVLQKSIEKVANRK